MLASNVILSEGSNLEVIHKALIDMVDINNMPHCQLTISSISHCVFCCTFLQLLCSKTVFHLMFHYVRITMILTIHQQQHVYHLMMRPCKIDA